MTQSCHRNSRSVLSKNPLVLSGDHSTKPGRTAFTLLELLIAVGLTSILMVALFSALQISFDLQLDSNEEITRQQVARTLLRQMARDIQSVVFVKKTVTDDESSSSSSSSPSTGSSSTSSSSSSGTSGTSSGTASGSSTSGSSGSSGSGSSGSSGGSSSSGSTSGLSSGSSSSASSLDGNSYGESAIDPETVLTTYTSGLVGTSSDLQLFVSRPDRTLSYVTAQELTSTSQRTSDLLIIRYLMANKGSGGLSSAIADRESISGDQGPIGLARMEGDLFGLSTAVETNEDIPQLNAAKLQAKEVTNLQFRYFDGFNWQEQWDSNALNEMPKAVEIILTLRNLEEAGEAFSDADEDQYSVPETTHRMVVAIPVAEPFVTESAL